MRFVRLEDADSPAARPEPPNGAQARSEGIAPLFAALVLASMLAPLNSTMLAVSVPAIAQAFGVSVSMTMHVIVTSYLVASIALQGPGGRVGDRFGHRRALAIGELLIACGALLGAFAPNLVVLASSRVVMAVGGAIVMPCAGALIRRELALDKRGRAFGTFGGAMALAAAVGPLLGGLLESRFGFRALFLVNLPVLAVAVVLAQIGARSSRASHGPTPGEVPGSARALDLVGSAWFALALSLLVIGAKVPSGRAAWLLGAALAVACLVWHERRVAAPLIDPESLSRPAFVAGAIVIALQNVILYSLLFLLPAVWMRTHALSSAQAGQYLMVMLGAMVVTAPIAGRLADVYGSRPVALVGGTCSVVGLVALAVVADGTPLSMATALAVIGVGVGITSAPAQSAAMSAAPREGSGVAAGLLATSRYLGGVAGMLVLGAMATLDGPPAAATSALLRVVATFLPIAAVALAATWWLGGSQSTRHPRPGRADR